VIIILLQRLKSTIKRSYVAHVADMSATCLPDTT
jgi:hypothetical protein